MKKEHFDKAKPLFSKKAFIENDIEILEHHIEAHYTEAERLLEMKEQLVTKLEDLNKKLEEI